MRRLALLLIVLSACEPERFSRIREPVIREEPTPTTETDVPSPTVDPVISPPDAGEPTEDAGAVDAGSSDADAGTAPDAEIPARECYTEPFDPTIDVSDLEARFGQTSAFGLIREALARRYPGCEALLEEEEDNPYTGSFTSNASFGAAAADAMTECHEATHGWDYGHSLFYEHFDYFIRGDLQQSLGFNVNGFARSQIYGMVEDDSTDLYLDLYLSGDQGSRGLLELLDEMNCYINGLGAIAALADQIDLLGISGRDGAVAFLYYLELYLRRARMTNPTLYTEMRSDEALKEHVKTQWLRTHFYLAYADLEPRIGIHDGAIRQNLYAPHNISEISQLIGRCVDTTNCLCD